MSCEEPNDFITNYKMTLVYYNDDDSKKPESEAGYLVAFRLRAIEACEAGENLFEVVGFP